MSDEHIRRLEREATSGLPGAIAKLNQAYARYGMWKMWTPAPGKEHLQPSNRQACESWRQWGRAFFRQLPSHLRDESTGIYRWSDTFYINSWATIDFSSWTERDGGRPAIELDFRYSSKVKNTGKTGYYLQSSDSFSRIIARLNRIWTKNKQRIRENEQRDHERKIRIAKAKGFRDQFATALTLSGVSDVNPYRESYVHVGPLEIFVEENKVRFTMRSYHSMWLTKEDALEMVDAIMKVWNRRTK